jgi:hypothetical protein
MGQSLREWRVAGEGDRHEERGVVDPQDGVGLFALEVEQLTGPQLVRNVAGREGDPALHAFYRNLPRVVWAGIFLPRGITSRMTFRLPVLTRAVVLAPAKPARAGEYR